MCTYATSLFFLSLPWSNHEHLEKGEEPIASTGRDMYRVCKKKNSFCDMLPLSGDFFSGGLFAPR